MKLIVIVVSMLLAGCATPVAKNLPSPIDYVAMNQVQIDDQFNMIDISLDNIFIELKKCVPLYSDNAEKRIKNDFPQPSNKMLGHGQASSSKVFFIKGNKEFVFTSLQPVNRFGQLA
jgi:hypothetical protein